MHSRAASLLVVAAGVCASVTMAQTGDQGTILRQRLRLDDNSIAASTDGWLSSSSTPRFWAWATNTSVNDDYKHPLMHRWIEIRMDSASVNNGAPRYPTIDLKAQSAANLIVDALNSGAIVPGDYGLFFSGLQYLDLHDHSGDDLDDMTMLHNPSWSTNCTTPSAGSCDGWSSFLDEQESPTRASPWRANGASLAADCLEYFADCLVTHVLAHPDFSGSSFPAPARIFFDEERGVQRGLGNGIEPLTFLAIIEAITSDARWNTEQLVGSFALWDSTPSSSLASEVFSFSPATTIMGWNSACQPYRPNNAGAPINLYQCNIPNHQNPSYDHEFFPIYNHMMGVLSTSVDGAIAAAVEPLLDHPDWTAPLWSNYRTSAYFSPNYPVMASGSRAVVNPDLTSHQGYGFMQFSTTGNAPIQSPVLYPPHAAWEEELGIETGTNAVEHESAAWLRYARMQLDHIIFSFDEFNNIGITSPRHVVPWITRVGTVVSRPSETSETSDTNITTKSAVRDIVALCKAKGINEIIFWGNPDSEYHGTKCNNTASNAQYNWDSTNDILSQVFDYNLNGVQLGLFWITPSLYTGMMFSEEHTFELAATTDGTTVGTAFAPRFSTGSATTAAPSYALILETIDGGGPWDGATYTVQILNHTSGLYETVPSSPTEIYSTSTRRAVFSDTDSDGYSNTWTRTFDDQADLPSGSFVMDRKTIQRWDINLPIGSASLADYISGGNMQFRIEVSHSNVPGSGVSIDPLRVDLVQLYETECENNNIPSASASRFDLNSDGVSDWRDIASFTPSDPRADFNGDGEIDHKDLEILVNEFYNR